MSTTNRFITRVSVAGECLDEPDFAIIAITPSIAGNILANMGMAKYLSLAGPDSFYSVDFWDASVSWHDSHGDGAIQSILDQAGRNGFVLNPALPVDIESTTTEIEAECGTVKIYKDYVQWTAIIKHTTIEISTRCIPERWFRLIVELNDEHSLASYFCPICGMEYRNIESVVYIGQHGMCRSCDVDGD